VFRGHKVLLDEDLATLYGVATGVLVQAVKRNIARFPEDFMFQLTAAEWAVLRSRIVISTPARGGRRFAPYVFTEQGVAMLSSVLSSERAIAVNIEIMRAFVKLRDLLSSNRATGSSPGALRNWRHGWIKSSPSTMRPSPPSFRPSAGSWVNHPHTKSTDRAKSQPTSKIIKD